LAESEVGDFSGDSEASDLEETEEKN
jgi:hypothetical protein